MRKVLDHIRARIAYNDGRNEHFYLNTLVSTEEAKELEEVLESAIALREQLDKHDAQKKA